ncbi:unnamed protein product [Meganyctiphanes norvegica]|uniref:Uncharacterized protein n=1 Tax=Meganyctiphanes norvegica TaxID=48144 RepID=A0AAV2STP8_MEGNR
MALISLVDGLILIAMGLTDNIWVAYIGYLIFRVSYQVLITIASYQVARELRAESYGLVFGINMFFGLLIQSILTIVIIDALEVEPQPQFVIYGCYFGVLSLVFIVISSMTFLKLGWSGIRSQGLWEERTQDPAHDQTALAQSTDTINT